MTIYTLLNSKKGVTMVQGRALAFHSRNPEFHSLDHWWCQEGHSTSNATFSLLTHTVTENNNQTTSSILVS